MPAEPALGPARAGSGDSEANHRFCREELEIDSLICSQEAPLRHRDRHHAVPAGDGLETEQGRRSGRSGRLPPALKGCDEVLTARLESTQQAQALLRGLAYNVQRLVSPACALAWAPWAAAAEPAATPRPSDQRDIAWSCGQSRPSDLKPDPSERCRQSRQAATAFSVHIPSFHHSQIRPTNHPQAGSKDTPVRSGRQRRAGRLAG
jgi:hypothetical protein